MSTLHGSAGCLAAAALIALTGCDRRDEASAPAAAGAGRDPTALAEVDRSFAIRLAEISLTQIAQSRVAAESAAHPKVRAFADMLVRSHTGTLDALADLATAKGVALSGAPTPEMPAQVEALRALTGTALDRAYLKHAIATDEAHVELLARELREGADPELKAFAVATLPLLLDQLRMAKALAGGDATPVVVSAAGYAAESRDDRSAASSSSASAAGQSSSSSPGKNPPRSARR